MTELRTLAEVAEQLRVSRRTVEREIERRRLRLTKIGRGSFVRQSEIDRYLRASERRTAA